MIAATQTVQPSHFHRLALAAGIPVL